jgi:hypothetical protein
VTIPELVTLVLGAIRTKFYAEKPARDFPRDERALTKAILTWGYACDQRGWDFTPDFILKELMAVLIEIQKRDGEIQYLPVYLAGAVKRSVGQRAEQLSAQGRKLSRKVTRVTTDAGKLQVQAVVEMGNTETMGRMFLELKKASKAARAKPREKTKQAELL